MSTEQKNKALIRRFLEAHAKGDLNALEEMLAPEYVNHSMLPGHKPDRDSYLRAMAEYHATYSNIRYVIEKQLAEDDEVVTSFSARLTHDRREMMGVAPTGKEYEVNHMFIHRIAGGKIAEEMGAGTGLQEMMERRLEQEIRERERVEQELHVARRIQEASLPKEVPTLEGWRITPFYQPAREVGGDFYEFIKLDDGRVGFAVGDATGKGVPAAFVMSATCALLGGVASASGSSPGEALSRVNEVVLTRIPSNMFVTCFYAILDPRSGSLRYANAGHDLPYLWRGGDADELRATGMPLGLMPGMSYEEKEIVLDPGEGVFFYSDGLVEAHDPRGEMFGFPRLRRLVGEHGEEGSLGDYLLEELYSFVGEGWEQEDDITLLTLKRFASLS